MNARHISHAALLALIAAGAVACAKPDDAQGKAWACGSKAVPGGEVVSCSQSAILIDDTIGTTPTDTSGTIEGCSGALDNPESCGLEGYTCAAGEPDCVPDDVAVPSGGAGGTETAPAPGTTTGTPTSGSDTGTGGTTSGTTAGTPTSGSDTGTGGTTTGPGNGNGKGGGGAGGNGNGPNSATSGGDYGSSSHSAGNNECVYTPELPCGTSDSTSSGATSDSSASGDSTSGDSTGHVPPGRDKKDAASSSSSSSGATSSDGTSGTPGADSPTESGNVCVPSSSTDAAPPKQKGPKKYKCAKDKKGNKKCESISVDCLPGTKPAQTDGSCWITGGGFIIAPTDAPVAAPADGHDNFGGNAKTLKDGRVQGHWNHVDHGTKNHAKGKPEYIVCRHEAGDPLPGGPGAKKGFNINQVYFGGHAEWRDAATGTWASGYWFDVVAEDHGEPGSHPSPKNEFKPDEYHFTIRKIDDATKQASGTPTYETHDVLAGGNIRIHPSNPGRGPNTTTLPSWVQLED